MRFIGKTLIILNTGLSITFLLWAVAVYFEKVDWFTPSPMPEGKQIVGVLEKAQAKLKDLSAANQQAARRWGWNAYQVYQQEIDRPQRLDFYRAMLHQVVTGKDLNTGQAVPNPVRALEADPATGLVKYPMSANPINARDTVALDSLEGYDRQIMDAYADIQKRQAAIKILIDKQKELTDVIHGTPEKKGLRTLIREQEQILKDGQAELSYLAPFWTNRYAEHDTLLRRVSSMDLRRKELEKFEEARGGGR